MLKRLCDRLSSMEVGVRLKTFFMKKRDIYRLRAIIQELKNIDDNDRDPMQKDKKRPLFIEAIALCNDSIDSMKPM